MRHNNRWRFSALAAPILFAPVALAQTPLAGQGQRPASSPRPASAPIRPANYTPAKPASAPGLLPTDVVKPAATIAPKIDVKLTRFDPLATEVRRDGRNWQLWSGPIKLKDFGDNRDAAYEARRLVAELKLTERGAIGTPLPVMEFWLSQGEAPPLPGFSRNVIPFDPAGLRVLQDHGAFYVGDARHVLFNFGPHEADARQALEVIKRYEFNELGFVGSPEPSMTYLLKNATPRRATGRPGPAGGPQMLAQQSPRHALELPGLGRVGERRPFDVLKLDVRKLNDGWHLAAGPHDLGPAGSNEHQARTAAQIVQRYPLTEYVRLGTSDFGFYLSHGAAPRGVPLGVRRTPFQPRDLQAKKTGAGWTVGDGRHTLGTFASAEEASVALKVIQHYGFNCRCDIGTGLQYLARE